MRVDEQLILAGRIMRWRPKFDHCRCTPSAVLNADGNVIAVISYGKEIHTADIKTPLRHDDVISCLDNLAELLARSSAEFEGDADDEFPPELTEESDLPDFLIDNDEEGDVL